MAGKVKALRGLIYSMYPSEAGLARELGWSRQRMSRLTNGQREPDVNELNALAKSLNRNVGEIAEIFLTNKSPNGQREGAE